MHQNYTTVQYQKIVQKELQSKKNKESMIINTLHVFFMCLYMILISYEFNGLMTVAKVFKS
jgi:hypothetical protein